MEVVEHDLLQVHLHLLHLPQDHAPLPLDLLLWEQELEEQEVQEQKQEQEVRVQHLSEGGVGEDVGEDLHGLVEVPGEALRVEHRLLPAGVRVQVSAHVLHLVHGVMMQSLWWNGEVVKW